MDTSLPTVTPQDQPPDANPAEAAFAELSAKVDFLETLLRGLVAKREAAPDYSETLGEIATLLEKMRTAIKTLAARPAMTLTPDAMAEQIAAAAARARAEDAAINQQGAGPDRQDGGPHGTSGRHGCHRARAAPPPAMGGDWRLARGDAAMVVLSGHHCAPCQQAGICPNGWRRGCWTLIAGRPGSACLLWPSRNAGERWFSPMRSCRKTGTRSPNAARPPRRPGSPCAALLR